MKKGNMFNFSSKGLNIGSIFNDALKDTFKVFKWTGKVMFKPVSTTAKNTSSKVVGSNKNQNTIKSSLNNSSNKLKNNNSNRGKISESLAKRM